ncbi:MAG: sugar phosphate nucleotidyltransferase [Microgenomates group bacterium]
MKVRKAVIAAAGRGTRFLPTVKAYPKELISILNKPQIQYLVEEIIGAGIKDICIVHLHGNPSIKRYFTPNADLEEYLKINHKENLLDSLRYIWQNCTLKFIPQPRHLPYGNSSPILAAKNFIGVDPFVYLFGDDLTIEKYVGHFLSELIHDFEKNNLDGAFAIQPVPHDQINRYGCIQFKVNSKIKNQLEKIIEKPSLDEAPSDMANCGRAVVSAKIIPILAKKQLGKGNELWFVDALNQLAAAGTVVAHNHLDYDAPWYTTGDAQNWLRANLAMAKNLEIDIL